MERTLVKIIQEICNEEDIALRLFADGYVLRLEKGGRTMFVYANKFPHNCAGTERICDDKAVLSELLEDGGIPHVAHFYFDPPKRLNDCPETGNWGKMTELLDRFRERGIVCKPNNGTGGRNVIRVKTQKELEYAAWKIFSDGPMCVSPYYEIEDEYRVLMLDNEVQYIFRKIRPRAVGDGVHTLAELSRQYGLPGMLLKDADPAYVPAEGEAVGWKHNLGQGATPEIVPQDAPVFRALGDLAKRCTVMLGLGFVSVDIVKTCEGLLVLEINSGVMVDRFASFSPESHLLVKTAVKNAIKSYLRLADGRKE